jgi:hypothetical protein
LPAHQGLGPRASTMVDTDVGAVAPVAARSAAARSRFVFVAPAERLHVACEGPRYPLPSSAWSRCHRDPGKIGLPHRAHATPPRSTSRRQRFLAAWWAAPYVPALFKVLSDLFS